MFEKLLEIVVSGWKLIAPFVVIPPYDNGVILRLGLYHRTLAPGFHWKWPLFEDIYTENVCVTTLRLPPQTLTSVDGTSIVATAIIKYEIRDIRPYITGIYDQNDVLADVAMGAVARCVRESTAGELLKSPPEQEVLEAVRKEVNQYGFKVHKVTFTDLARVRSYRLIAAHTKDLAN